MLKFSKNLLIVLISLVLSSTFSVVASSDIDKNTPAYKAYKQAFEKMQVKESKKADSKQMSSSNRANRDGKGTASSNMDVDNSFEESWIMCIDLLDEFTSDRICFDKSKKKVKVSKDVYTDAFLYTVAIMYGEGYNLIKDEYPDVFGPDDVQEYLKEGKYFDCKVNNAAGCHTMTPSKKNDLAPVDKLYIIAGVLSVLLDLED